MLLTTRIQMPAAALFIALVTGVTPAHAGVAEHAKASIATFNQWQARQPANVVALIESGSREARDVQFEIVATSEWTIESGPLKWNGRLEPGQKVELRYRATPVSGNVQPLRGRLLEAGFEAEDFTLNVFPAPFAPPPAVIGKRGPRRATGTFTANGNVTFPHTVDGVTTQIPLKNATVKIMDKDPLGDNECASGVTGNDGSFSVSGSCYDVGFNDYPDLYAVVQLKSAALEIKPRSSFAGPYEHTDSRVFNNTNNATVYFTNIRFDVADRERLLACHMYNAIIEARQFLTNNAGVSMPKVTMEWPQPTILGSYYNPVTNIINVEYITEFDEVDEGALLAINTAIHEYGHHFMSQFSDLAAARRHSLFSSINPELAWSEGFAEFFATAVMRDAGHAIPRANFFNFENHFHLDDLGAPVTGPFDQIELFVANILNDLTDSANDDQHSNDPAFPGESGPGRRDSVTIPFRTIFDTIRLYDPNAGGFHNHARTIHEFWDGMKARNPALINHVSEVYREHHILKPQPDLVIPSVEIAAGATDPGSSFIVRRTVSNQGNEIASPPGRVRYRLLSGATSISIPATIDPIPANLGVGASQQALVRMQGKD